MAISRSASADYEIIFDIRTCRHFEIIKIKQGGNINSPPALSGTIPKIIILGIVIVVLFHFLLFPFQQFSQGTDLIPTYGKNFR